MKKKEVQLYVVVRYFRGSHVQTMCKPTTKDEADNLLKECNKKESELTQYGITAIDMKFYNRLKEEGYY